MLHNSRLDDVMTDREEYPVAKRHKTDGRIVVFSCACAGYVIWGGKDRTLMSKLTNSRPDDAIINPFAFVRNLTPHDGPEWEEPRLFSYVNLLTDGLLSQMHLASSVNFGRYAFSKDQENYFRKHRKE